MSPGAAAHYGYFGLETSLFQASTKLIGEELIIYGHIVVGEDGVLSYGADNPSLAAQAYG